MPEQNATLDGMPRTFLTVTVSQEIKDAIHAYCGVEGVDYSEFIRTTLCKAIGKPGLAKRMRKPGRQKAEPKGKK